MVFGASQGFLFFVFFFFIGCAGSLLLRRHYLVCGEWEATLRCSAPASHSVASLVVKHGLWVLGLQ